MRKNRLGDPGPGIAVIQPRGACPARRMRFNPGSQESSFMGRAFECRRRAKEARWDTMSRVFPKLAKAITMAAKNGGPDPAANAPLRLAIANAKGQNLQKDRIDAAIK